MGEQDTRGAPPGAVSDADRARAEQALTGRAEPDTNESRQMRAEAEGNRGGGDESRRLTGEEGTRALARFLATNAVLRPGASEEELDRLRIQLGDEEHESHVALRDYHRAVANHRGHPPGSPAYAREVDEARKRLEANPTAKKNLDAIERARRRNEPVDFTQED